MDEIRVLGIEFRGLHGVDPAEQVTGNRFSVDVRLELDLRTAGETDDLAATVSYADVARLIWEIGTGPSVKLVETLAERMAARLLCEFAAVHGVEISVAKLHPPASTAFSAGVVRIRRTRR